MLRVCCVMSHERENDLIPGSLVIAQVCRAEFGDMPIVRLVEKRLRMHANICAPGLQSNSCTTLALHKSTHRHFMFCSLPW